MIATCPIAIAMPLDLRHYISVVTGILMLMDPVDLVEVFRVMAKFTTQ